MVVTITLNPSFDKSLSVKKFTPGDVNYALETRTDPGGKGVNVSKVLNVLGCHNIASGIAGRDNYDKFAELLIVNNINFNFVLTPGSIRTNIKINEQTYEITTDINEFGPTISAEAFIDLKHKLLQYNNDTVFVISGSIGKGTEPKIISELTALSGHRVIVDTSGIALKEAVKASPYIITPNLHEFSELMDFNFKDRDDIIKGAKELISQGIHGVMITLGGNGLIYVTEKLACFSAGLPVNVKSTVGAGDAVTAAVAYSVVNSLSANTLTSLAASAGTAAVTTSGSQAPEIETINHFMQLVNVEQIQL